MVIQRLKFLFMQVTRLARSHSSYALILQWPISVRHSLSLCTIVTLGKMTCLYLLSAKNVLNFPANDMHVRSCDVSETIYFDNVAVISALCTVYVKVIQGRHYLSIYAVLVLKKSKVAIIAEFM